MPHHSPACVKISNLAFLVYLLLFLGAWLLSSYLPEQFFRDQSKLVDSLLTDGESISSFRATATMYSWLTFGNPEALIPLFALGYMLLLAHFTSRTSALLAAFFLFVPSLFLNLVVLGKETLVIGMSSLVVLAFHKAGTRVWPLLFTIALYFLYGTLVRPYFLAIIGLFLFLLLFLRAGVNGRIVLGFSSLLVFFLLPAELYSIPALHRDTANNYASFRGTFDIRTMVHNVVIPETPLQFLFNYFHTLCALNFPVLFFHGLRDAFITLTNLFVLYLVWQGYRQGSRGQQLLSLLMLSHLLVLALFEPDVGSYTRHLLSVSLYAASALTLLPRKKLVLT